VNITCNLKSNLNYKLQPKVIDVNYKLQEFHCVIALQFTNTNINYIIRLIKSNYCPSLGRTDRHYYANSR